MRLAHNAVTVRYNVKLHVLRCGQQSRFKQLKSGQVRALGSSWRMNRRHVVNVRARPEDFTLAVMHAWSHLANLSVSNHHHFVLSYIIELAPLRLGGKPQSHQLSRFIDPQFLRSYNRNQ